MSNDENLDSNKQAFCVTATDAKSIYFLDSSDIKWIPHESIGGRYYGGNFKLFTPASLEAAAIKKHGKEVYEAKKQARQDRWEKQRQREVEERISQKEKARKKQEKACKNRERVAAKPKRSAITAWTLFQKENWGAIKKENPDRSYNEIVKLVSNRYKALSVDERKVLDEKADKQRQVKVFEAKCGPLKRKR